jgi:archaeosine synthase beta-subunit
MTPPPELPTEHQPSQIEESVSKICHSPFLNGVLKEKTIISHLYDELQYLRSRPLSKQKSAKMHRLDAPVASFSKPDRLHSGMGTEITLIFRSSACSWAGSPSGGCTMCGYWNDRASGDISPENYWHQFEVATAKYSDILTNTSEKVVFKLFTSGSFCDPREVAPEIQARILSAIASFPAVQEVVIESRPEYITDEVLDHYRSLVGDIYLEFGIGLETSSDYIRKNIINKGFTWNQFLAAVKRIHQRGFGAKAYLLFKPPFIPEYAAMLDMHQSIRDCIRAGVDTISINPTNIQQNTICGVLYGQGQFRSPGIYSLLWLIRHSVTQEELKGTQIICDPSAAGKERGVHNFTPYHLSNGEGLSILQKFVQTQDLESIPPEATGIYERLYQSELIYRKN